MNGCSACRSTDRRTNRSRWPVCRVSIRSSWPARLRPRSRRDPQDRFPTNVAFVEAVRAAAHRDVAPAPPRPVQGDLLDATAVVAGAPAVEVGDLPLDFPHEGRTAPPAPAVLDTPEPRPPRFEQEPERPVFWRGEIAASAAETSPARSRGLSGAALVAVFAAGMALGAAGGYLVAARRPSSPVAVRADLPPAGDERTSTPPPSSAGLASAESAAAPANASPAVEIAPPPASVPPATSPAVVSGREPAPEPRPTAPPAAAGARLLVRSSPGGATVTVDGVARGTTPLVLRDLADWRPPDRRQPSWLYAG